MDFRGVERASDGFRGLLYSLREVIGSLIGVPDGFQKAFKVKGVSRPFNGFQGA